MLMGNQILALKLDGDGFYRQIVFSSKIDDFIAKFKTANKITMRLSYIDIALNENTNYTFE